ncbi:MAG TPA: porin [Dongiaceae bacterium]|nr:porin [Dongiaceae bacterium]
MKRILLGTSALVGAGLIASPAFAADGIKLGLGGFFRTSVDVNIDNNGNSDLGHSRDASEVTSDAEIYFLGSTTLDNGLTVGARVELEGEQKTGDQIDAAFVYFQGGFGELRIGSQDSALAAQCVTPVGGTSNFGAFSQDTINNNAFADTFAGSATVCEGVDSEPAAGGDGKAQKLVYLTPSFGGFQLALSWTPNDNHESGNGHVTMNSTTQGDQKQIIDAYLSYNHDFEGFSVAWGGGGSWALATDGDNNKKKSFYQTGMNLTFGDFSIGGAVEYMKDENARYDPVTGDFASNHGGDMWVAGGGLAYKLDAWTFGAQYSYSHIDGVDTAGSSRKIHQAVLTGQYDLGPGIALDGELGYAHADGSSGDAAHGGYDSFNFGLGTAFTF